ncbi:MAG: hypothetical protein KIS92_19475 [Planctomycetota bacterium]|nr:hypothetical protein [Planctomycetota bacterium]
MKLNFLTYFDVHYVARGLTMIESLFRHHPRAALSVLCVDAKTAEIVQAVHGDRAGRFTSKQLAAEEPRLAGLRAQRAGWEFYASQKPIFIRMAMDRMEPDELAVYIDADCYFHTGIEEALAELEGASIGITPHRFSAECADLRQYGTYNAGFAVWRNNADGRACLLDWSAQCLDWCFKRVEGERFMNQGYLTAWPDRFQGVKALRHPGLNVGPWNLASHCLESTPSGVRVDGRPLLFYHFSSVFLSPAGAWQTIYPFPSLQRPLVLDHLYRPYCAQLDAMRARLQKRFGIAGTESLRTFAPGTPVLDLGTGKLKLTKPPDPPSKV